MLNRLPRQLPALSLMVADIGNPSTHELARSLDVTPRTVRRWLAADLAPRCAGLALFWLTRWGMSAIDAEAHQAAMLHAGLARARAEEIARLRVDLAHVLALADHGAANVPSLQVAPLALVLPFRGAARRPTGV